MCDETDTETERRVAVIKDVFEWQRVRQGDGSIKDVRVKTPVTDYEATFLAWGLDTDEDGSYSIALLELEDGSVTGIYYKNIKFLKETS